MSLYSAESVPYCDFTASLMREAVSNSVLKIFWRLAMVGLNAPYFKVTSLFIALACANWMRKLSAVYRCTSKLRLKKYSNQNIQNVENRKIIYFAVFIFVGNRGVIKLIKWV